MSETVNLGLGKLIHPKRDQKRDATHIALAPVTAAVKLHPGQKVGFVGDDTERVGPVDKPLGIIDPFLSDAVFPDQRCWMWLFPQSVTGMRHEWEHPAFTVATAAERDKAMAVDWINRYASGLGAGLEGWELIGAAESYLDCGEYLCKGDVFEGVYLDQEFWDHFQVATGRMVASDDRGSFFTCSC